MKKIIYSSLLMLLGTAIIQSCSKNEDERNISSNGDDKSHNTGQNCMNCHKSGGPGEGIFKVAGTLYDSLKTSTYPNAIIKLFTGPNGTGTLKYTIQVDAKGNFFTTDAIDFGSGLYPAAMGSLTTKYMGSSISMGQCNSCHGISTEKMWTR